MEQQDIVKLTEAQREALRYVQQGYEAKEIARELGISPHAVTERLRSARRIMGTTSSRIAARRLLQAEGKAAYMPYVDTPIVVVPPRDLPPDQATYNASGEAPALEAAGVATQNAEPDLAAPQGMSSLLAWPFPTERRPYNDLTAQQTLTMTLVLTIILGLAAISAVTLVDTLSRLKLP
jgi:DNA-binding CsgD family transcriptional regulator